MPLETPPQSLHNLSTFPPLPSAAAAANPQAVANPQAAAASVPAAPALDELWVQFLQSEEARKQSEEARKQFEAKAHADDLERQEMKAEIMVLKATVADHTIFLGFVMQHAVYIALKAGTTTYSVAGGLLEARRLRQFTHAMKKFVSMEIIGKYEDSELPPENGPAMLQATLRLLALQVRTPPTTPPRYYARLLRKIANMMSRSASQADRTAISEGLADISFGGDLRNTRNRFAHQVPFRTFLAIAIHQLDTLPADSPMAVKWQRMDALFYNIHNFSLHEAKAGKMTEAEIDDQSFILYNSSTAPYGKDEDEEEEEIDDDDEDDDADDDDEEEIEYDAESDDDDAEDNDGSDGPDNSNVSPS